MKLKKMKFISVILVLLLLISGCSQKDESKESEVEQETEVVENLENDDEKESKEDVEEKFDNITLVDNVGREVELPYPIKTAVVANRYNSELIRACGAIDRVISVDTNTAQDREYWGMFDPDEVIGKSQRELNYEKIAELNPQVVILPDNGAYEEAEETLEPFGIKVFVISGYDTADFKNQVENIGKMFNTEEDAQKFYNYFNDKLEYIQKNIKDIPKTTMYLETTTKLNSVLPGDYFYNMADFAGADNIFSTEYENINKAEIDPEEVIRRNPEVIIKLVTPDKALSGTGLYEPPTKEEFIEVYEEMISRPGWEDIEAVKNNNIYFMTQFSHGGASKLVGTNYIAKSLYGDVLPVIDPEEIFKAWLEDFQGFKNVEGHFYSAEELINE